MLLGAEGGPMTELPRGPVGIDAGAAGLKPLGPLGGCRLGEPSEPYTLASTFCFNNSMTETHRNLRPSRRSSTLSAHQLQVEHRSHLQRKLQSPCTLWQHPLLPADACCDPTTPAADDDLSSDRCTHDGVKGKRTLQRPLSLVRACSSSASQKHRH